MGIKAFLSQGNGSLKFFNVVFNSSNTVMGIATNLRVFSALEPFFDNNAAMRDGTSHVFNR